MTGPIYGNVTIISSPTVEWPRRVGVVPAVVPDRVARPADHLLEQALSETSRTAVVCQVLGGFGGVGKTQLAANLAEAWWRHKRVDLLVWATATSRTSVLTRYSLAAGEITAGDHLDPQQGADRFLAWLSETDLRWLVVLDDLTNPADLHGLWPPSTPTGRTIVTTRRRDAAVLDGRHLVDVDLFTPDQALAYLRHKLSDQTERVDQAADLAADLGHLPLALAQAAAYIKDQDLTCAGYRQRLTRRPLARLAPRVLPDDQPKAVEETWAVSIDLVDTETGGVAGPLLELAALLDPNGIPCGLLTAPAVIDYCAVRAEQPVDGDDTRDAMRALYRLGLTTSSGHADPASIRMHAVLQRVVRENTPPEHRRRLATVAADALQQIWTDHHASTAEVLRANTSALRQHADAHLWVAGDGAHPLLFTAGDSLGEAGLGATAHSYYQQLHDEAVRQLGPDHPDALAARHALARWGGHAGHPHDAVHVLERLLDDSIRVLGPDHASTLATRHELAHWRGHAEDPHGAVDGLEELLDARIRVLGPDHHATLDTRHQIAHWRGRSGDSKEAVTAYEELLHDRLRLFGPDDPSTLTNRHELAHWRGMAGDHASAVTTYEELLRDRLRLLGPDHQATFTTRHELALWQGRASDPAQAVTAYEQLLSDRRRVLGPRHPHTLATEQALTRWRKEAASAGSRPQARRDA